MTARDAATLQRVYEALVEKGCDPEWTMNGEAIVATCPCCDEKRGLTVTLDDVVKQ